VTANEWKLLVRCVEDGVRRGVRLAWKHSEAAPPSEDQIERIQDGVIQEIGEWFTFPPDPDAG